MGVEIEIATDEQRMRPPGSEVDRLLACNAKACELLGWQPQYGSVAGLRKGLAETVAWFRQPENLSRYKPAIYNI
jgi:dTDP-glucose 4,6-dehydratase